MEGTLELIRYVVAPFENQSYGGKLSTSCPDQILKDIVQKCRENGNKGSGDDDVGTSCCLAGKMMENCGPLSASWSFTITVLDLLVKLRGEMEELERGQREEEQGIEVISVQAQLNVQKCVELVVGFGLLPYLLQKVGVPEKVRKRNVAALEMFLISDLKLPPLIKFHRLAQVTDALMEVGGHPSLGALIIPKHAADLLAGLLQITKSPIAKPSSRPDALSPEEYEYVIKLRERFNVHVNNFLESVPKPALISALFLIGEQPKFMREACTSIIRDIIITSENGVILTASALLSESSASNVWNIAKVVANLVRGSLSVISEEEQDRDKVVREVCSQCVQMICSGLSSFSSEKQLNAPFGINREMTRVGLFCAAVLMDGDCELCKCFVWDHLFKPLLDLELGAGQRQDQCERSTCFEEDEDVTEELITSVEIERVIGVSEVAEGLLSLVIPTGISIPIQYFQPLWSLFLRVLGACRNYLQKKVQEPEVSQLALVLKNKLENVFVLMFEVISAGCGERLQVVNVSSSSSGAERTSRNRNVDDDTNAPNKITTSTHISQETVKTLCEFCVELVVRETSGINCFDLMSGWNDADNSQKVKIVRTRRTNSTKGRRNDTDFSGYEQQPSSSSPSSSSSKERRENNNKWDKEEDANAGQTFEVLADYCIVLCSILKDERLSHITSQFFLQLLSYENENENIIEKENRLRKEADRKVSTEEREWPTKAFSGKDSALISNESKGGRGRSEELTRLEAELRGNDDRVLRKFVSLKLLEELGGDEKMVENCVKTDDYKETLFIVELVMRKLVAEAKDSSCAGDEFEFTQSIVFALGFLGTLVETAVNAALKKNKKAGNHDSGKGSEEFWDELQRFVPHLQLITKMDNLSLIKSGIIPMADSILLSIKSRGKEGTLGNQKQSGSDVASDLEKALQDVYNPMLPVKGHGLLQLRRLIEARDPNTIQQDALLLQVFQAELINEDSYIYLMAIQGLAALGLKFHKVVIPVLIEEYGFLPSPGSHQDYTRSKMYQAMTRVEKIEFRMKVGEALVKVIQQLGAMAPMYRVPLVNAFFRVVRDEEPLIRASALSNLGELCHVLRFSLGAVLTEVWFNIESVLNCEKDIHVRRAALHLLVLLVKGVEREFEASYLLTDVELGGYLRDARRLLTRIEQGESDPVSKTHAQLALHELELIVKKLLLPKQELTYKIRLLDTMK